MLYYKLKQWLVNEYEYENEMLNGLPPRQQVFYRKLALAMTIFRMGNSTWWGFPPAHTLWIWHSNILFIFPPICLLLQLMYLYIHFSELPFRTLGTMFSIIPATTVVMIKILICVIPAYPKIMKELMDKIHLHNFLDMEDDFIKKKVIQVEQRSRWISACLTIFILFDWLLWILIPLINNIKNKELIENRMARMETCLYMWMPFDYEYDYNTWAIAHAINVYCVGIGACIFAIYDSINFIFIFHFLCHIDILRYRIESFFNFKLDDYGTKEKIISVIKYHSFILSTFKDMQSAFGINVALNYAHNLIVDSLLLYQIMIGDKANRLTYVFMMQFHMGGLILLSLALEHIRIKTDELSLVLYKIPWENMSVANQKLLIPILLKMQTPLVFKASGGLAAGVQPLASAIQALLQVNESARTCQGRPLIRKSAARNSTILKSTFSYYVMLKSSIE